MFWVSTALLTIGLILELNDWSKLGLDLDKNKSKTIKKSFDDSTTLLVVFFDMMLFVIIGTFIMIIEFELFMYLSVWNLKKILQIY